MADYKEQLQYQINEKKEKERLRKEAIAREELAYEVKLQREREELHRWYDDNRSDK